MGGGGRGTVRVEGESALEWGGMGGGGRGW